MHTRTPDLGTLLRQPDGWLPIAMSVAALALVVGYATLAGTSGPAGHDEQGPARLFQLILLGDAVIVGLFAVRWLPRAPRPAALILALQLMLATVPILTVILLESRA
jgi:hypothetical protein